MADNPNNDALNQRHPKIYIAGTGSYVPETRLTNYDLEKSLDTSHDWIIQRTGRFRAAYS